MNGDNGGMDRMDLLFHIARRDGLEFVFTSGHVLAYPTHTHESVYTVTVVRSGTVCLTRKEAVDTYQAGAVYVVAPREPHSPEYSDDFDIVSLCVKTERVRDMEGPALLLLCAEYCDLLQGRGLLCPETVRGLLAGVEEAHRIHRQSGAVPEFRPGPLRSWVEENDGSDEPHDAPPGMSQFRFIRKFKDETGLTPHQYIVQDRLRKAKALLADKTPIVKAAVMTGFYDQSHLNRWFRKSVGVTPRLYAESCFFLER